MSSCVFQVSSYIVLKPWIIFRNTGSPTPSSYPRSTKRPSIARRPLLHPMIYNRSINGNDSNAEPCESCQSAQNHPVFLDGNLTHSGMFFRQKLYSRLVEPGDSRMVCHVLRLFRKCTLNYLISRFT